MGTTATSVRQWGALRVMTGGRLWVVETQGARDVLLGRWRIETAQCAVHVGWGHTRVMMQWMCAQSVGWGRLVGARV